MDETQFDFSLLSAEQLEALDNEQKAIYQTLSPKDKAFFATTFNAKELPGALTRKGEIIKRNQAQRERLAQMQEKFSQIGARLKQAEDSSLGIDELVTGAAAAIGIGAVAAAIATDNTATWQGVPPRFVANALEANFGNAENTDVEVEGDENSLLATIYLTAPSSYVPAMTVALIKGGETLEVKVSDLTAESKVEVIKAGGKALLDFAVKGLIFWQRRRFPSADSAVDVAQSALDSAFNAAKAVKDLNLKDRVWAVIKEAADAREKSYKAETERIRQERLELEAAWDAYYHCPQCGVSFAPDDDHCRVCGRGRNPIPSQPDPRQI